MSTATLLLGCCKGRPRGSEAAPLLSPPPRYLCRTRPETRKARNGGRAPRQQRAAAKVGDRRRTGAVAEALRCVSDRPRAPAGTESLVPPDVPPAPALGGRERRTSAPEPNLGASRVTRHRSRKPFRGRFLRRGFESLPLRFRAKSGHSWCAGDCHSCVSRLRSCANFRGPSCCSHSVSTSWTIS